MTDDAGREASDYPPPHPPELRQGPGAFAWISFGLLVLSLGAFLYAVVVGAHGGGVISLLAAMVLVLPTVILMAVWIEVEVDNRKAMRLYNAAVGKSTQNQ